DAIRHAVAAGEMTWAARLIEQHFDAVHSLRGEAATVQRWLTPLPADLVRSRPPAAAGASRPGRNGRPPGGRRAVGRSGRGCLRRPGRGAVRAHDRPGWQPAGE